MPAPYIPYNWLELVELVWSWIPYGGWMLEYDQIPMKAELVEGVVVLCGRWTVSAEAGVT